MYIGGDLNADIHSTAASNERGQIGVELSRVNGRGRRGHGRHSRETKVGL